jgi:hypothetical protein
MLLNGALQSLAGKTLFGFNPTYCTELFDRPASQLSLSCSVVREVSVPNTSLGLTRHRSYSCALSWTPFRVNSLAFLLVDRAHWDIRWWLVFVGSLCGIRTEVLADVVFVLITGLQLWDCKSIAKASKVRIPSLATTRAGLNSAGSSRKFGAPPDVTPTHAAMATRQPPRRVSR